jgi:DNA-3-methyladenine glycosylase II
VTAPLELEVLPPAPYRLPRGSDDRTLRVRDGVARRLLRVEGRPVLARAWQTRSGAVRLRAAGEPGPPAGEEELALALERLRFVLGLDLDLSEFHSRFRRDPLVGPLIRRFPGFRPRLRVWPWEALQAAVVGQLIEAQRAVTIERRIVGRWGARVGGQGREALRDVPDAALIAGRAPAELAAMDLAPSRAAALRRVAIAVARGLCPLDSSAADPRLLSIPQIGPWTVQCLALFGRADLDALPAGDLGYIKLVGRLAGLGRRATVAEVEEFYAPYEPYRGLVGTLTLAGLYRTVAQGPPLRFAA